MPYGQAKGIIDAAEAFHQRASVFYQELKDKAAGARVKMLLDYMFRHEAHLKRALADFKDESKSKVLDEWRQYEQEQCLLQSFDVGQFSENMTVEEVLKIGFNLDSCLIASYKGMAATGASSECREIFENLLLMEEQEKHKLARIALEIDEM
ncbi:MAG: hypothetical protein U9N86_06500 [Bacteroidota bacterium]|nr:hypothetical protein [Bacteroidota bacterium]